MREAAEYVNDFYIYNATGPVKSSVLCVILLSPRERELYIGEGNRDGVPGQQQREQKSRIALCSLEHCESSRSPSLPTTSYCFDLNNILNNMLRTFHLDEVREKIYALQYRIS